MPRQTRAANTPEDTRMQRDRLQAEKEQEQQARAGELTMITATENANDADGVWDPQTQELVQEGMSEEEREALIRRQAPFMDEDDDSVISEEDARTGALGEHTVRTDDIRIGPNGVPIGEEEDDFDDSVISALPSMNVRPGETEQVAPLPEAPVVGRGEAPRSPVRVNRAQEKRIIRVNADLDPTIGRENYHFAKGRRYEVPIHVANHLHEKGYVSSFG